MGANAIRVVGAAPAVTSNFQPQQRSFTLPDNVRKVMHSMSGYNQFGLYLHDVLMETDEVKEAVRRLPPQMQVRFVKLEKLK